jgi:hypothetical protein
MNIARQRFGKHHLKVRKIEPELKSIASQLLAQRTFPLQQIDTNNPLVIFCVNKDSTKVSTDTDKQPPISVDTR